jgi:hypothetical protein
VPDATSCQTTWPLLQRPNCFSPLQTTAPLLEQVPAAPPAPGVDGAEPPPVEGEDGAAGVPVPPDAGTVGCAGVGAAVTVTRVVEVGVPDAPGAKTPPGLEGGADAAGADAAGADAAGADAAGADAAGADAAGADAAGAEGAPPAGTEGEAGADG